jgi:hypothetical protein
MVVGMVVGTSSRATVVGMVGIATVVGTSSRAMVHFLFPPTPFFPLLLHLSLTHPSLSLSLFSGGYGGMQAPDPIPITAPVRERGRVWVERKCGMGEGKGW